MKRQQIQIGMGVAVILGAISYMAYAGMSSNLNYFVTIPEMQAMGSKAHKSSLHLEGFVKPQTIAQSGSHVTFVLTEFESHNPKAAGAAQTITVQYDGIEPPPDTFKGDAQAVAIGTWGQDGVFHANQLQAKCASKYAPAQPGQTQPGQTPAEAKPAAMPASKTS
jgi:cytochrome c-type biogenesis protein CcmE